MEFTLLAAAIMGVAAIWLTDRLLRRRYPDTEDLHLFDMALGAMLIGLVVGRLAAMVLGGTNPLAHPSDILLVRGGVDTGWASLAALGWLLWSRGHTRWPTLDFLAPLGLAGLSGYHAGCLPRGSCLGTTSSLPWAVSQAGSDITRHPVEVYAAILFLLAAIALMWLIERVPRAVPFALGLGSAALIRLATEPMRPSFLTGVRFWYVVGILVALAVPYVFKTRIDE